MGDQKNITRRNLLVGGAAVGAAATCITPFERLLDVLTKGFIKQAQAEDVGQLGARNYINFIMIGAPMRYTFDSWMRTHPSDPQLEFNPMVTNKFVNSSGRVVGVENATFNYNGVLVPHMFSHSVFKGDGGTRPLTDLLNHMLVIRGYGTGFDGHPFNAAIQQRPIGGVSSVLGLAADYSRKTFEAVEWPARGAFGSFTSMNSKALNSLNGNPLTSLLEGFSPPVADRSKGRSLKERNMAAYDLAQARMKAYAASEFSGAAILRKNLSNATLLMKKGTGNIDSYWDPAVKRYRKVIEDSMRQSGLLGISDFPLFSDGGNMWGVHVAAGNTRLVVSSDFDLRDSIKEVTAPDSLSEGLALAEYVIKEGLVTSLNLQVGDITNLILKNAVDGSTSSHLPIKDMHLTGAFPGVLITTAYYRAFAAGLLELIDQLKSAKVNGVDLWSETVVQLISDFNRSARSDGLGSDHGFDQMVTSVFSGAIQRGPFVVGNIQKQGHNIDYSGTQGIGAPIDDYNQKGRPTPVMAASTVAELLRVPKNPYENIAAPLVHLQGDQLRVLKTAKIVGG